MSDALFDIGIHAAPVRAQCFPANGGLVSLTFSKNMWPRLNIFTGNPEMAVELHAAISDVLEKHNKLAAEAACHAAASRDTF